MTMKSNLLSFMWPGRSALPDLTGDAHPIAAHHAGRVRCGHA
jgi:hypothetical protein